jgi:hypothetical protein
MDNEFIEAVHIKISADVIRLYHPKTSVSLHFEPFPLFPSVPSK